MYCSNCSTPLTPGMTHCPGCGALLVSPDELNSMRNNTNVPQVDNSLEELEVFDANNVSTNNGQFVSEQPVLNSNAYMNNQVNQVPFTPVHVDMTPQASVPVSENRVEQAPLTPIHVDMTPQENSTLEQPYINNPSTNLHSQSVNSQSNLQLDGNEVNSTNTFTPIKIDFSNTEIPKDYIIEQNFKEGESIFKTEEKDSEPVVQEEIKKIDIQPLQVTAASTDNANNTEENKSEEMLENEELPIIVTPEDIAKQEKELQEIRKERKILLNVFIVVLAAVIGGWFGKSIPRNFIVRIENNVSDSTESIVADGENNIVKFNDFVYEIPIDENYAYDKFSNGIYIKDKNKTWSILIRTESKANFTDFVTDKSIKSIANMLSSNNKYHICDQGSSDKITSIKIGNDNKEYMNFVVAEELKKYVETVEEIYFEYKMIAISEAEGAENQVYYIEIELYSDDIDKTSRNSYSDVLEVANTIIENSYYHPSSSSLEKKSLFDEIDRAIEASNKYDAYCILHPNAC